VWCRVLTFADLFRCLITKFADDDDVSDDSVNCAATIKHPVTHLFLVEIFERVLEAFFEPQESEVGFDGPPDLDGAQCDLRRRLEDPDLTRFLLVRHDRFAHLVSNRLLHVVQQTIQPHLHLQPRSHCVNVITTTPPPATTQPLHQRHYVLHQRCYFPF